LNGFLAHQFHHQQQLLAQKDDGENEGRLSLFAFLSLSVWPSTMAKANKEGREEVVGLY
jgi:hypothetical protein